MADLTDKERELIARGNYDTALVRPAEQWAEIFRGMSAEEAAARIFGDLLLYRADQKIKGSWGTERRDGFIGDVQQLANALRGWPLWRDTP
jgi:hypothetical protein